MSKIGSGGKRAALTESQLQAYRRFKRYSMGEAELSSQDIAILQTLTVEDCLGLDGQIKEEGLAEEAVLDFAIDTDLHYPYEAQEKPLEPWKNLDSLLDDEFRPPRVVTKKEEPSFDADMSGLFYVIKEAPSLPLPSPARAPGTEKQNAPPGRGAPSWRVMGVNVPQGSPSPASLQEEHPNLEIFHLLKKAAIATFSEECLALVSLLCCRLQKIDIPLLDVDLIPNIGQLLEDGGAITHSSPSLAYSLSFAVQKDAVKLNFVIAYPLTGRRDHIPTLAEMLLPLRERSPYQFLSRAIFAVAKAQGKGIPVRTIVDIFLRQLEEREAFLGFAQKYIAQNIGDALAPAGLAEVERGLRIDVRIRIEKDHLTIGFRNRMGYFNRLYGFMKARLRGKRGYHSFYREQNRHELQTVAFRRLYR